MVLKLPILWMFIFLKKREHSTHTKWYFYALIALFFSTWEELCDKEDCWSRNV